MEFTVKTPYHCIVGMVSVLHSIMNSNARRDSVVAPYSTSQILHEIFSAPRFSNSMFKKAMASNHYPPRLGMETASIDLSTEPN